MEVINDHNNMLMNFYLCIQNDFEGLRAKIQNTLHSETLYLHAKDIWNKRIEGSNLEKAWAIWVITNSSFAGSMQGGWKYCNGSAGSHTGIVLNNKRIRFSEELKIRMSEVQISCRDYIQVIKDRDSENTFFYIDPPYPGAWQGHYSGYTHNQFYELLQILSKIKGKFILSNYWNQTLKYHVQKFCWNVKQIEVALMTGRKNQKRTEILVFNFNVEKTLFN